MVPPEWRPGTLVNILRKKLSTQRVSFEVEQSCHGVHPRDYMKGGGSKAS